LSEWSQLDGKLGKNLRQSNLNLFISTEDYVKLHIIKNAFAKFHNVIYFEKVN